MGAVVITLILTEREDGLESEVHIHHRPVIIESKGDSGNCSLGTCFASLKSTGSAGTQV